VSVRLTHNVTCCTTYLVRNLFLFLARKVDKVIVLCADQEGYRCLIEASSLAVPLLDRVQRALPCQVEHEEYGHSIITDQRQHVYELALATEIPDRERDFRISDRDSLLHKVDTCRC
jgi:hypothetical protein